MGFRGKIIKDWDDLLAFADRGSQEAVQANAMLKGAFKHFLDQPMESSKKVLAKIQEFTSKEDFPAAVLDYIEKYNVSQAMMDISWQQVFDVKDFTGTTESGFKLRKVTHGVVFEKLLPGEKVKIAAVKGEEVPVNFVLFGAALGYDKTWWDDQRWWDIEDETAAFRSAQYKKLALIHIALVEALSSAINQAWDTNLVKTVNNACAQLITDASSIGMDVGNNPNFIWWAPLVRKAEIEYVLRANYLHTDSTLNKPVVYQIVPAFSPNFSANTNGYLCLPKGRAKSGNRQGLEVWGDFDILKRAFTAAAYFRIGAGIGEAKQFRRVPFSG